MLEKRAAAGQRDHLLVPIPLGAFEQQLLEWFLLLRRGAPRGEPIPPADVVLMLDELGLRDSLFELLPEIQALDALVLASLDAQGRRAAK